MHSTIPFYSAPLTLLTDLYQLTMAYGYWKTGHREREAVFHLHFRKQPFAGGYAIACGLAAAAEWLASLSFSEEDVAYLATLTGNDGGALFDRGFLDHLRAMRFSLDVDAVPEGTAVFAQEPLVRVKGPLLQCQLVETALLCLVNFQTLIATKAARVCAAAKGDPVLEFGLRRAQGIDGALSASRAAFVGGCASTSNVLAGRLFDIPVRGTHAHSWVMSFGDELESFRAYADAMPNNCVFLVDTYDTLEGVRHAVTVGKELRARGHELVGVRLDSGDLAYLSIEARKILDEGGFPKAAVLASNDLDEHLITSLKTQGATIGVWGVGTKLATAYDQPALGGVYKLGAVRDPGGAWQYRVKLSEQAVKISTPGVQQVRRFERDGLFVADMIYDSAGPAPTRTIVDPLDMTRQRTVDDSLAHEDLLVPVFRDGVRVGELPTAREARARTERQVASLHAGIRRFDHPHQYPVGLEKGLFDLRTKLILEARGHAAGASK
ncbi:MAG: nicotinate phosphoribosyltransferase [Polyangiales bacterium]